MANVKINAAPQVPLSSESTGDVTRPQSTLQACGTPAVSAPLPDCFKGFDKDWKSRGFQYEVGKTYKHDGAVKLCESGFHAVEYPLDVFSYYEPGAGSQFAEVALGGATDEKSEDSKRVGSSITIKAALTIPMLVSAAIEYTLKRCEPAKEKHATGHWSASSATGDRSASSATGYRSASSATGDRSASSATGDNAVAAAFGLESRAKAGKTGAVIVAWRDTAADRKRYTTGYVGENGIKPDTWYRANEHGELVEAA